MPYNKHLGHHFRLFVTCLLLFAILTGSASADPDSAQSEVETALKQISKLAEFARTINGYLAKLDQLIEIAKKAALAV